MKEIYEILNLLQNGILNQPLVSIYLNYAGDGITIRSFWCDGGYRIEKMFRKNELKHASIDSLIYKINTLYESSIHSLQSSER